MVSPVARSTKANLMPAISSPQKSLGRRIWRLVSLLLFVYLVLIMLLGWFENSLIFPAPRYPRGDWEAAGADVEDVFFQSTDGTRLHGWFLDHPNPRYYVLYCHGNGENVAYATELQRLLHDELQLAVFAFDYRGYGRSEGSANEAGVLQDARAAQAWLAQRAGVEPHDIVLMGRSLGGAVAVDLAADTGTRGLVLESTFSSMPDVAARLFWWAPARLIMRSQFNSVERIQQYRGPLLQSHGTRDGLIPIEMGRRLFAAAPSDRKQFLDIQGADHNDPQGREYYVALDQFLRQLPE